MNVETFRVDQTTIHLFDVESKLDGPLCLTREEEVRASRFRFTKDQTRWRLGRHCIRECLAKHLGLAVSAINFELDPRGRPSLPHAPKGFDFNWSHSGPLVALAISEHGRVGIDLEIIQDAFPALEIAETFFNPSEYQALLATADLAERQHLFFSLWTAKEALMKGTGLGAALEPRSIEVQLRKNTPSHYISHGDWWLHSQCRKDQGIALTLASNPLFKG